MLDFTSPHRTSAPTLQGDSDVQAEIPTLAVGPKHPQRLSNERALWTLVGIGLLWWSWRLNTFTSIGWTVPFLVIGNVWGLATVLASWLPEVSVNGDGTLARAFQWGTAALTVTLFVVWGVGGVGDIRIRNRRDGVQPVRRRAGPPRG